MKRQYWTVVRRLANHDAAERRWDQAYLLLLSVPAVDPAVLPTGILERNRHARSPLRPGVDEAPSPGAND